MSVTLTCGASLARRVHSPQASLLAGGRAG